MDDRFEHDLDQGQTGVRPGWEIVGADDQRIGDVTDVEGGYLHFTKGMIGSKDVYVPSDAISEVDPDAERVYLNVSKSEIDRLGWNTPPSQRVGFGSSIDQTDVEENPLLRGGGSSASSD